MLYEDAPTCGGKCPMSSTAKGKMGVHPGSNGFRGKRNIRIKSVATPQAHSVEIRSKTPSVGYISCPEYR